MNKYSPALLLFFFAVVSFIFMQEGGTTEAQPQGYEPLEGTLYKGHIDSLDKADVPLPTPSIALPLVNVFLKDLKWVGLPSETKQFIAKLVPEADAKVQLVLPMKKHSVKHIPQVVVIKSTPTIQEPVHEAPKVPELSFSYFNSILSNSDNSFALSDRFTKGAITFLLSQVGKWRDLYLVKCTLVNEGEKEFFISSLSVTVNGRAVPSDSYIPFSCPPHESVVGVVTFQISAAINKQVSVTMIQDGDKYEKLEIENVGYKF